jgi:VanZ family protein
MSGVEQPESLAALEPRYTGRLRHWLPPLLWIAMIALGGGDWLSSGHTARWLAHLLAPFHLHTPAVSRLNFALRKFGHFCVYAVLSILLFRAWRETLAARSSRVSSLPHPAWSSRAFVLAISSCVLVASLDEFHQSFTASRGAAVHDVVLDSLGAVFAQMLLIAIFAHGRDC